MTRRLHTNNAATTLATTISTASTSISVTSSSLFPAISTNEVFHATISQGTKIEVLEVTAVSGTTWTVTRAAEGTTAQSFTSGAVIDLRSTANGFDRKADMVSTDGDVLNFGDATSLEIPNNATATLSAAGQIAVDTSVTDYADGVMVYRAGSTDYGVIAIPKASLASPTNGYVVTYDSTLDQFKLAAGGGGGGGSGDVVGPASSTDNALVRFDSTTGKLIQNSGAILSDDNNLSANNIMPGYTTTATAAGTTTLTVSSTQQQRFTGSTTQNVNLPVTSTLALGFKFEIINDSTGAVTVRSSGANNILVMSANTRAVFVCILTSGTTAASWTYDYTTKGALPDADYGDITVSSGVWSIDAPSNVVITSGDKFLLKTSASSFATMAGVAASNIASQATSVGTLTTGTWNATAIAYNYGGTGLTTVAQGDLLYGSNATTWSKLTKDTNATRYLSNQGTSNNPSWNQVNLANGVTGTLPSGNVGGVSTNSNAAAGILGEFISSSFMSLVAITSGVQTNVTSISLTAGDWDVWGAISAAPAGSTVPSQIAGKISQTTADVALPTDQASSGFVSIANTFTTGVAQYIPIQPNRISLASTTTIYLNAYILYSVSSLTCGGIIMARRAR